MNPLLANTTVQVLGKNVTDPVLQQVSVLAIIPIFIGMIALVMTSRMVDEERIRAEPSIAKLFGRGLPPRRILTDTGRKVQMAAFFALGIGGVLLLFLIIKTR
jgi:hypothetical protein